MKRFVLKEEHLKLLRNAVIRWEDAEFGAPAIDCKRPYGNSFVYGDIAEILNIKAAKFCEHEREFSQEQLNLMEKLHQETKTALQIIVATGKFEAGIYEADDYKNNWRLILSA